MEKDMLQLEDLPAKDEIISCFPQGTYHSKEEGLPHVMHKPRRDRYAHPNDKHVLKRASNHKTGTPSLNYITPDSPRGLA